MEPYIKYIKIFVILLWAAVISGTLYFVFIGKNSCEVNVSGKCYSQANLNAAQFVVPGTIKEGINK